MSDNWMYMAKLGEYWAKDINLGVIRIQMDRQGYVKSRIGSKRIVVKKV